LPDEQRLEEKMETLGAADMDRLAETIATFHRNRPAEPPSHGFRSRLQNVLNTIRTVGGMDFEAALHSLLSSNRKTLNTRRFHEVDGHGDLRPDHIYLSDDAVNIIDCVEFSADIRQVDPYEDLAFATMGLRLNHRPDLARHLALSYLHRMCDVRGFLLMDLYEIYRAAVRLMVDALQLKEAGGENRADYLRRRSEAYASLIEDLISGKKSIHNGNRRQLQGLGKATATDGGGSGSPHAIGWKGPLLILLAGLPATGKSRIAALIREEGIPVLSSDVLRKKDDTRPEMRKPEAYGQGSYSSKKKMLNYRKLMCQAGRLFEKESVVCLDASFSRAQYRNLAYRMVSRSRPAMDILILQTDCSEEIIRRRLDKRKTRPGFSDLTDFDTWKKLKENFESVDLTVEGDRFHSASGARLHHLILDTSGEKRTSISPELKQMVPHLFLKRQS
ncbi:MAG: AAA family ATPase, partial [Leptospiraceae bacterium]|nr:AAA family ATPase [Leptospiraceae bacterium]